MELHNTSRADLRHARRVSCIICAKGKRRCSRQIPTCTRCAEKGFVCRYPAPRISYVPPVELIFSSDGPPTVYQDLRRSAGNSAGSSASSATANGNYHEQLLLDSTNKNRDHLTHDSTSFLTEAHSATTGGEPTLVPHLSNPWFLAPSSWVITDNTDSIRPRGCFNEEALRQFPEHAMAWLKQWSVKGHCPFIHLNQQKTFNGFPDCLQDAYTVTAAYTNSTPATKHLALRILQSRAAKLVSNFKEARPLEDLIFGPMTALSRLQALLVYTIVGLFDGDIRARGQAESNLDILTSWATELWERTVLDISQGRVAEDHSSTSINDHPLRKIAINLQRPKGPWMPLLLRQSIRLSAPPNTTTWGSSWMEQSTLLGNRGHLPSRYAELVSLLASPAPYFGSCRKGGLTVLVALSLPQRTGCGTHQIRIYG
ncbi:hypothetical protein J3F84DRAFT_380226 [Trichoderma pleuroticola]